MVLFSSHTAKQFKVKWASIRNCRNSFNFQLEPNVLELLGEDTWKLTLQSAPIFEATHTSHVSLPVAWQLLRAGLTLVTVEYSTSASMSANWAIPPGFGIIRPPQDMYSVTKREKTREVCGWVWDKGRETKRKRGGEIVRWPWQPNGRVVFTVLIFDWWVLSDTFSILAGWKLDVSSSLSPSPSLCI